MGIWSRTTITHRSRDGCACSALGRNSFLQGDLEAESVHVRLPVPAVPGRLEQPAVAFKTAIRSALSMRSPPESRATTRAAD
jgi:hypothetical protein